VPRKVLPNTAPKRQLDYFLKCFGCYFGLAGLNLYGNIMMAGILFLVGFQEYVTENEIKTHFALPYNKFNLTHFNYTQHQGKKSKD
jgi:hypothetical protein